jgi:hypothetical protein
MSPLGHAFGVVQEGPGNLVGEQGAVLAGKHVHDDHGSKEARCE